MKLSENLKMILKSDKNKMIAIACVFFIGVVLIFFPCEKKSEKTSEENFYDIESYRKNEEKRLEKMLSQMKGVESATVYISYEDTGSIDVVNEEKSTTKKNTQDKEFQTEKTPVYNSDKNTVVKKFTAPKISGVCVFYKGDDSKSTKENISKAVKGALGTEIHKIETAVLK